MPSSSAYTQSCSSEGSEECEEEDESAVSSYCSSDEGDDAARACYDDTYGTRLKRVLAWRDHHAKAAAAVAHLLEHPSQRSASSSKRRADDTLMSHPQKQARSHRNLRFHPCSACDADFPTRQSLREHARVSSANEACRAAVEYGFES
ncbi:hypothetical protein PHLGIDRAFT_31808 [Phlebiopsis gigantea 11061_1 CR5-6]|uniref:C2H2-type domain-containing protein n=1 Tax=Phlebiopsis gigantea (strain 11061_1 CR5-6) TaxID=745531 RepID=A0A0C3S5B7_PHLG1|nr:hypothetical protein PHLGIDRAFT_31808 [Phlebiopsis gigantea 11061_1 CR5-6]